MTGQSQEAGAPIARQVLASLRAEGGTSGPRSVRQRPYQRIVGAALAQPVLAARDVYALSPTMQGRSH